MTHRAEADRPQTDARPRVLAGHVMAALSIALAVYGMVALLIIGRPDHITRDYIGVSALIGVGFGALTWVAVPRQPRNGTVWVLAWAALFSSLAAAGWATAILLTDIAGLDPTVAAWNGMLSPSDVPSGAAISWMFMAGSTMPGVFLPISVGLLLFPDGVLPSRRWRWVAWSSVAVSVAFSAALVSVWTPTSTVPFGGGSDEFTGLGRFVDALLALALALSAICIAGLVVGFRRSTGVARQQYRWIGWGGGAVFLAISAALLTQPAVPTDTSGWQRSAILAATALFIASYAIAVTKYRLYNIDLVVSRTFAYGTMAGFIGAVYVLVVVVVGGVLGSGAGNIALAIVATAVVAIAFEPVRRNAQRWANRLVYGKRATPYEVLSNLTRRLADAEPAQGVLARMALLMAEGTGADQATVWLADREERLSAAAGWPELPTPVEVASQDQLSGFTVQVRHEDQVVGVLQVTKPRGNPVTSTEAHLIADLAGSAGLVLGNQRLNAALAGRAADLRESRRRLVEAQDLERRRLERDLHDGAQQQVVALKLKIGLAEHVAKKAGVQDLARHLDELSEDAQAALDEIRRLAKGIYPPLLESEGLAAAIKAQAATWPVEVRVDGDDIGRHPKDIESAVYFAAVEAVANAVNHGAPTHIQVMLTSSEGMLSLDVTDDGAGFDPKDMFAGTGLVSVRDRVEALGGRLLVSSVPGEGTTVAVQIPLDYRVAESSPAGDAMALSTT